MSFLRTILNKLSCCSSSTEIAPVTEIYPIPVIAPSKPIARTPHASTTTAGSLTTPPPIPNEAPQLDYETKKTMSSIALLSASALSVGSPRSDAVRSTPESSLHNLSIAPPRHAIDATDAFEAASERSLVNFTLTNPLGARGCLDLTRERGSSLSLQSFNSGAYAPLPSAESPRRSGSSLR